MEIVGGPVETSVPCPARRMFRAQRQATINGSSTWRQCRAKTGVHDWDEATPSAPVVLGTHYGGDHSAGRQQLPQGRHQAVRDQLVRARVRVAVADVQQRSIVHVAAERDIDRHRLRVRLRRERPHGA